VTWKLGTAVPNSQQIVGVPGVVYPFTWDGTAICSFVRGFWSAGGGGSIVGCLSPSTETTSDIGFNGGSFREQFDMTVSDTAADSFDGYYNKEVTTSPGNNTCYWSGSGLAQNPGVTGSQWTIGTVAGVHEHNHWGYDSIGWNIKKRFAVMVSAEFPWGSRIAVESSRLGGHAYKVMIASIQ